MTALTAIVIPLLLMPISCFVPGFLIVRRWRWTLAERLCASIGVSIVLLYLLATVIYLSGLNWNFSWVFACIIVVLAISQVRHVGRFVRTAVVERQLMGFAFLLLLGLLLLCLIENYSGGDWTSDWSAHYRRTLFFLQQRPHDNAILVPDVLTSRPPLMNLVATYFVAQSGRSFESFQVVFAFMGLLVAFPCFALAGILVRFGARHIPQIAAVLAISPMVMENATWTWTKQLCAFYVLLSLALYLHGWKRDDAWRIIAAAGSMAAAILVHYSAIPFAIAIALHYLLLNRRCALRGKTIAVSSLVVLLLLLTWFGWALLIYGPELTFGSNTTVVDSQGFFSRQNGAIVFQNIIDTIIPHPLRSGAPEVRVQIYQPSRLGFLRDYLFLIYQTNLPFSLGCAGVLAFPWLMASLWRRLDARMITFWVVFLLITFFLGIATVSTAAPYGLAHVVLQPISLIALTVLGAAFARLPRAVQVVAGAGFVVDAILGIVLNFRALMVHITLQPGSDGAWVVPLNQSLLSIWAVKNAWNRAVLSVDFLGSDLAVIRWLIAAAAAILLAAALFKILTPARPKQTHRERFNAVAAMMSCVFLVVSASLAASHRWDATSEEGFSPTILQGNAFLRQGKVTEGYDCFIDAFLLDPSDRQARYAALVAISVSPVDQSDVLLAEFCRLHPFEISSTLERARRLRARRHVEQAIDLLETLSRKFPDSPVVVGQLREMFSEQGHDAKWIAERLKQIHDGN